MQINNYVEITVSKLGIRYAFTQEKYLNCNTIIKIYQKNIWNKKNRSYLVVVQVWQVVCIRTAIHISLAQIMRDIKTELVALVNQGELKDNNEKK